MDSSEQGQKPPGEGMGETPESPARDRITDDIRERMSSLQPKLADEAEHAASAIRRTAVNLHDEDGWIARLVEEGANKLSELSQTLRTSDLQTLVARTEDFARREPVLFAGAAVALGFLLTRTAAAASRAGSDHSQERAHGHDD